MNHPLQQFIPSQMQQPQMNGMQFANPVQQMAYMMQAMQNPVAFVRANLPGIPEQIINDPNRVLQYMMQNLGVTQQDIQNVTGSTPRF